MSESNSSGSSTPPNKGANPDTQPEIGSSHNLPASMSSGTEEKAAAPAVPEKGKAPSTRVPGADRDKAGGIGDLLLREKVVTLKQLEEAEGEIRKHGGRLGNTLARLGYVEESQLVNFLSRQYGVPSVSLDDLEVPEDLIRLIPREVAERHNLVPINRQGSSLIVAMSDPSNIYAMDDLKFLTGYNVEVVVATESAIKSALQRYYDEAERASEETRRVDGDDLSAFTDEDGLDLEELERSSQEAPVVRLVNLMLVDAIKRGASDIHVEPYEKEFRIRYRIDGVLYEIMKPPLRLRNAITSRLKIMSELDIAERRLPQDGRIKLTLSDDKDVDFRVSVLPTLFGEKIVLRILDKSALQLDMTMLGFEPKPLAEFKHAVHQPYGMVLVTGPTGSGKTTTLYSALTELNQTSDNISTAEDPVEINMAGVNQVAIRESIGLTFAAALRSFLRQDPDIIMVGEIRDFETAEIAIKAALTGHLVLSTVHTNDAPSTINRLLNMGIEPFLVTASLNLVLAQRLARRICKECKGPVEDEVTVEHLVDLGMSEDEAKSVEVMEGKGCRVCNDTGYKGRVACYEVMPMSDELKECVLQGYSAMELKRESIRLGMQTLRRAALNKLGEGQTTVAEVIRVSVKD